ncbi:MAG TPA: peptidase C69 [candidate division Zixibacteria bacterium]|nr:peptidase C69 [candidate division Zixibacteria bacterium]
MKSFAKRVIESLPARGLDYADVRITDTQAESIAVRNGIVESVSSARDAGFGLRVMARGAWGFASSARLEASEIPRVVKSAVEIARASALTRPEAVRLAPQKPARGSYRTAVKKDPFAVPLERKISLLLEADRLMRKNRKIKVAGGALWFTRERKTFASTEGALTAQEITESGGEISALAVDGREVQTRSYPNMSGDTRQAGYEFIEWLDFPGNAERAAGEAALLLKAPPCPAGETTIIIASNQLALQVHESIGHPIELDRVFGTEAAYAGTSFLTLDKLHQLRYGSDIVNVYADATVPGGLGTFGWDDEGVPAQRVPIIDRGRFAGYLTSRETASKLGEASGGAMRADGWNRIPLIRMTNINLEPGSWSYPDLIADTDDGILFDTTKTWSIDDKRLNFQFATEIAWRIRNGKVTSQAYKNATYTGMTPRFWNSCDAVCNMKSWRLWGIPNCGKGQPGQSAHVGHGVSPARFRRVQVGVSS